MANPKPKCKFKKGSKKASEAGKKSKRTASIKTALKNLLISGKADAEEIAMSFIDTAKEGNPAMAKLIMEYIDGKVKDKIEHSGDKDNPLTVCNLSKKDYIKLRKEVIKKDDV